MRHKLSWSVTALLVSFVTTAAAQTGVAGSWDGKSMIGPKDSVVVTFTMWVAADGKSATMKYPGRDPIPMRILAIGGDSVVTEAGPYPSILRAGQTVTSLRSVEHYKGNAMWGTFEAHYENGDVVKGKSQATRAQ